MVGLHIKLKAERLNALIDNFLTLDMEALHSDLGEEGRNIIERRFQKGVDPRGKKWKRIKPYFNREHNELRLPSDIPLKLKDLYKSFSWSASTEFVIIGTPKFYGKYHSDAPTNNGGSRAVMPLREFMGFESEKDIDDLLDVIAEHVERAIDV